LGIAGRPNYGISFALKSYLYSFVCVHLHIHIINEAGHGFVVGAMSAHQDQGTKGKGYALPFKGKKDHQSGNTASP
jgi:hypothetical protein